MYVDGQASCLCYTASGTQTVYAPSVYDNAWMGCVNWAKTADTTDYPLFASVAGLCTGVGNIRSASATVTSTGSGSGAASTTSQSSSGGAVSTRTAAMTSGSSSSRQTGAIVTTSSSGVAAAGLAQLPNHVEVSYAFPLLIKYLSRDPKLILFINRHHGDSDICFLVSAGSYR